MVKMVEAKPDPSQELRTPTGSPTQVAGAQSHEPPSNAVADTLFESCIGTGATGT